MGAEGCSNSNQIDSFFSHSQLPGLNVRIGSVKVRHSRVQLAKDSGNGNNGGGDSTFSTGNSGWIPFEGEEPHRDFKLEEDEHWSLVDLLSRSASAAMSERRPRSSKSALTVSHQRLERNSEGEVRMGRNVPSFLQSGLSRGGGARHWRRPDVHLGLKDHGPLHESHEDNDADTEDNCDESEYNCRMSSGSSISWAEDAVETEQSERLAKLWNDVEVFCRGGERPDGMSDEVYEECLLWRRAFPVESSIRPVRFESMEDFLTGIGVEDDGDSTPTNDTCTFTEKPGSPPPQSAMNLRSRVLDEHDSLMPNPGTTTEFVTSWLTDCHLLGTETDGTDVPINVHGQGYGVPKGLRLDSANSNKRNDDGWEPSKPSRGSFGFVTPQVGPNDIMGRKIWDKGGKDCAKEGDRPQIGGRWIPSQEKDKEVEKKTLEDLKDGGDSFGWTSQGKVRRPSRLPIPIGQGDRFRGRRNSAKPFLLWVFDRVSPN